MLLKAHPSHLIQVVTTWSDPPEQIAVCIVCGAFGARKSPLLRDPCEGKADHKRRGEARSRVLRRIELGKHPSDKAHLKDILLA